MLDHPSRVEAEAVCEFNLFEGLMEEIALRALVPRTRQPVLVEQRQPHGSPRVLVLAPARRYASSVSTQVSMNRWSSTSIGAGTPNALVCQ